MKKTIIVGLIAVAMLFAFTACDNGIAYSNKTPVSLVMNECTTTFLQGSTIDLSAISGTVYYIDGSSQVFAGTQLNTNSGLTAKSAGTTIDFTYGSEKVGEVKASITIKGIPAESVTLTNLPTAAVLGGTEATITDLDKITATVVDTEGNTYNVPASAVTVEALVANEEGSQDVTVESVKIYNIDFAGEVEGVDGWKVTVAKAPVTVGAVDDVAVVYLRDGEEIVLSGDGAATLYAGDIITVQVWTVDEKDNRIAQVNTNSLKVLNGAKLSPTYTVGATAVDVDFLYEIQNSTGEAVVKTGNVAINSSSTTYNRSITGITCATKSPNSTFGVGDFTGTVTLSNGESATRALTANEITIVSGQQIPSDYELGSFTVYVYTITERDSKQTLTPVNVTVTQSTTPAEPQEP